LKGTLEILSAIKNAFDQHRIGSNDKRDGDAPLKSDRAQAGQQMFALLPSQGKRRKTIAEGHDTGDVIISPTLACLARDVRVQAIYLTLGARGEYNVHNISTVDSGLGGP
jgi:hypothetical protein